MSDQQGVLPRRPPPRVMGSPGLPPSVPVPGLPGDLLSQQEDFVPGAPSSFGATLSFSSECQFLEAAAHIPPPVSLQELQSAAVPSAALLGEEALLAMKAMLQQPDTFVAGQLFSHAGAWLDELQPSSFVRKWLLDGYSEYLQTLPRHAIWKVNSPSCQKHMKHLLTRRSRPCWHAMLWRMWML